MSKGMPTSKRLRTWICGACVLAGIICGFTDRELAAVVLFIVAAWSRTKDAEDFFKGSPSLSETEDSEAGGDQVDFSNPLGEHETSKHMHDAGHPP